MTDPEIAELVARFEDRTLPKSSWTHEAHFAMAITYLSAYGPAEAAARIRNGILRYNSAVSQGQGYHETITSVWITLIGQFLAKQPTIRPISELLDEFFTKCGDKDFLFQFYSRERLLSPEARAKWVEPDLKSLDHAWE
jgi:hypothetical protein